MYSAIFFFFFGSLEMVHLTEVVNCEVDPVVYSLSSVIWVRIM